MRQFLMLAPALLATALQAQAPEDVVIRTTTRLVQINVIVTKHGAPVPGLKKEDFQVFDNGKRQEIRQFSEDTRAVLPAAAEPLPPGTFTNQLEQRSGTPAGVTAILLDGVNTTFNDQSYARLQVIKFLQQIKPEDRIATFDQDGTLWVEHPAYAQAMFAIARVVELAPHHPEWKTTAPFSVILSGNAEGIAKLKEEEWAQILAVTHAGMSNEAFVELVMTWIAGAKHPRFKRLYTDLTYVPMREAMDLLRTNGFKTYIVTGGGQEFVRAYAERVYGVPPEQVIGSSIAAKYEFVNGQPALMREPKLFFNDNNGGKAIGINMFVGKRPYAAFGNSTGDQQMLEWTGAGTGARLKMLVYHDDPVREYAYGPAGGLPDSSVGTFSTALMTEAQTRGWTVISMKNDWKRIFSFE